MHQLATYTWQRRLADTTVAAVFDGCKGTEPIKMTPDQLRDILVVMLKTYDETTKPIMLNPSPKVLD